MVQIWSLPDYPRELTALLSHRLTMYFFLKQANHCAYFNPATRLEALNKKNLMNLWCCRIVDTCMIFTPTPVHVK